MKLPRNVDRILGIVTAFILSFTLAFSVNYNSRDTFAEAESGVYEVKREYYVTFYDEGEKLIVKTSADMVGEALERAGVVINDTDKVEPGLDTVIDGDNFFINIHRARPAVVKDGEQTKYIMTASYDAKTVAREAGFTVYDGDEVKAVSNVNFLEAGAASKYEITRNGGRTVTEEVEVEFGEELVSDYNLPTGTREVRQLGETGLMERVIQVYYENNVEVKRETVSEKVVREPVARIVAVGAKKSISPEMGECVSWARSAGVGEAELALAMDLIYHESGCRTDAVNASSGAYGIPQALPGSKMAAMGGDWETNPVTQIRWMIQYVNGRYGGWANALDWWYSHGWY